MRFERINRGTDYGCIILKQISTKLINDTMKNLYVYERRGKSTTYLHQSQKEKVMRYPYIVL